MKNEVHAPGFHIFALQILFYARCRAAVPNHEKGLYRQTAAHCGAPVLPVPAQPECGRKLRPLWGAFLWGARPPYRRQDWAGNCPHIVCAASRRDAKGTPLACLLVYSAVFSLVSTSFSGWGKVRVIFVPTFGVLSRVISAWCRAAPCLTIERPRPVPPVILLWLLSTR